MATYQLSTLRSRVQDKLDNTAFSTSILTQFTNDGIRDLVIQSKSQFYQKETSYTTSIGANTLTTVATDVLIPMSMRVYTPVNYATLLPFLDYQDVDAYYPNVGLLGTGPPVAWSVFAMVPFVVNNADAVYTLRSRYLSIPAELVNDTDVPLFPVTFSELIVLAGYKRALMHDDDFDQAQVVQQEIDSKLLDMNTLVRPQLGSPYVMRQTRVTRRLGRF